MRVFVFFLFLLCICTNPLQALESTKEQHQHHKSQPKLLIIMDDIKSEQELLSLQQLGLNITPSIFPQTPNTPRTAQIARITADYMVHLPLEALHLKQESLKPLLIGMSKDDIRMRLQEIKTQFPKLKYLNNHAGSKFTASYEDMKNLLEVFDELGLRFIDSMTTQDSITSHLSKEQNRLIMQRDIFLDNRPNKESIALQIAIAIQKAKSKGYAIAICHPKRDTFRALKEAKERLLSEVELISPMALESFLQEKNITFYIRSKFQYAQIQ